MKTKQAGAICWAVLAVLGAADMARGQEKPADTDRDLHVPRVRGATFTTTLQDGGGFQWDIQYFLSIGQGTNNNYSGGVYSRVWGQNINSNGQGWTNSTGDELEVGPFNYRELTMFRRLKIYRDQPLARWMDIFTNNTPNAITVPVEVYSSFVNVISAVTTSSGATAYSQKDWAFVTELDAGRCLLHIVSSPRAKLLPTVRANGPQLFVGYNLTIPSRTTAVLCYFEAQGNNAADLVARMKGFSLARAMKDISPAVRKLIVNLRVTGDTEQVDLRRSPSADTLILKNGDAIFGRITNKQFVLNAFYGQLDLAEPQVVGFSAVEGRDDLVRAALVGGQVITGTLKDPLLHFAVSTGGDLEVPMSRVQECSFRVSKDKPDDSAMTDPLILLRTGDRLAFDPSALACRFVTRHGTIDLDAKELLEVRLDSEDHGLHVVEFLNGSKLSGLLQPEKISLPLKLGKKLDVPRDLVKSIRFAAQGREATGLSSVQLDNGDELLGRLADDQYSVQTDFGAVKLKPDNIVSMSFDKADTSLLTVKLWDGSTLRGKIQQDALRFALSPGTTLNLYLGQVNQLQSGLSLPPDDVVKKVEKAVVMLSGPVYQDRQDAQEELIRLGPTIAPLLQKYAEDSDPEVRQRIKLILEALPGAGSSTGQPSEMGPDRLVQ